MDRGAWWATVHGVSESDTTKVIWHNNNNNIYILYLKVLNVFLLKNILKLFSEISKIGVCQTGPGANILVHRVYIRVPPRKSSEGIGK